MKRIFKYIIFALIAVIFIGTFIFLFRNSRPEKTEYQELEADLGDTSRTTGDTGKSERSKEVNVQTRISRSTADQS